MGSQALDMGGVGLPIYAGKDQFLSFVPIMLLMYALATQLVIFSWMLLRKIGVCTYHSILMLTCLLCMWNRYSTPNNNRPRCWNMGDGPNTPVVMVSVTIQCSLRHFTLNMAAFKLLWHLPLRSGLLQFKCRASTILWLKAFGSESTKVKGIIFRMLYLLERQKDCSISTTRSMCALLALEYQLIWMMSITGKYSTGYGHLLSRNS